jgi:uracil-DNA glycosylase family 4
MTLFPKPSERCKSCTLLDEPGPVWGHGKANADIMLVGEAPGAEEVDFPKHRTVRMRPFVGGSGRTLSVIANHAGLRRCIKRHDGPCSDDTQTFDANVVKCRPPGNRAPTELEIHCCAPLLIQEIEEHNPNVIVTLGETAMNTLTGRKGIGVYRGVPTKGFAGRKVFPTWHPAYIMRAQQNWPFAVHDLVRATAQSTFPEIRRIPIEIVRQADYKSTHADCRLDIQTSGTCTFDFETTGLSPVYDSIRMCGFAGKPDKAYVYDWTLGAQQLFDEIFGDPKIEVCGQNILHFDIPFAEEKGHKVRWEGIFDTMIVFHLCNSSYGQTSITDQNKGSWNKARGTDKDLAMIASVHTDMEYWKGREEYKSDLYTVCGKDVIGTARAAYGPDGLRGELKALDMEDLYYKHVLPVHLPLHRMSKRGFKIDEDRGARWSILLEREADRLEAVLKEGLGDPHLNLGSPKQMMELLYGKLKLPVQYTQDRKRGRRPTANAEAMETLAALSPDNAALRTLVDIRHMRKMKSTYVDPGMREGRLHPRFGVSKAANGRFNSQQPNAQNVPEEMRDIWIPDDEDYVILSADASQIEWRASMVLSGDPVGLELLASGVDNHRAVAAEALRKPFDEVTLEERHGAKFIVYGLGYGRGARSIAEGHNLNYDWVTDFIARFFTKFEVFKEWRDGLPAIVQKQHYLANPFKRRRWWFTREITEIYNFPPSSTAADMMIDEVIQLENELPEGATLRLTVHDEVVACVLKSVVKEAWTCIKDVMEQKWPQIVEASARPENVARFYPDGWFVPVDIGIGTNWKMSKSKDPKDKVAREALIKELGLEKLFG